MVSNKKKGYNFEYRIIKFLRMNGYYCIRSYASLGLYDIIAVPPKDRKLPGFPEGTLLIQAKYNYFATRQNLYYIKSASKHASEQ